MGPNCPTLHCARKLDLRRRDHARRAWFVRCLALAAGSNRQRKRSDMRRSSLRELCGVILALALCAIPALGQNASVSGLVTDAAGAVVPKADVSLTNTKTNVGYRAASDNDGIYRVSGLVPGTYRA